MSKSKKASKLAEEAPAESPDVAPAPESASTSPAHEPTSPTNGAATSSTRQAGAIRRLAAAARAEDSHAPTSAKAKPSPAPGPPAPEPSPRSSAPRRGFASIGLGGGAYASPGPAAALPPPAAAPPAAPPPPGPEPAPDPYAKRVQWWHERQAKRTEQTWSYAPKKRDGKDDMPQGETNLCLWWAHQLRIGQVPPQGVTIWLRSSNAQQDYEFYLDGDQCIYTSDGQPMPERAIYEQCRRHRRLPKIPERLDGRIRALLPDGTNLELGGGFVRLPPEPPEAPAPSWGDPRSGPTWGAPGAHHPHGYPYGPPPYGGFGAPPYGYPPPYGGAPPYGAPPWHAGAYGMTPPPFWAQPAANAPPPEAVKDDPKAVAMWTAMQDSIRAQSQSQNQWMTMLMERAFREPAKQEDRRSMWSEMSEAATFFDKLRGPQQEQKRGLTIHKVGEGILVENSEGEPDVLSSIALGAQGAAKDVMKAAARRFAGGAQGAGGSHAPKPGANGGAPSTKT